MKLILAQGNPGLDYAHSRHNVGFSALDSYAAQQGLTFQNKSKFRADVTEINHDGGKVLLVKPTTFYNETGVAARSLADFYKIDLSDILVIHDDLALPFGTIRTREKGSDAGNNGIKSLNSHLGPDYARIRIGIHNDLTDQIGAHDFVLARFSKEEAEALKNTILPKVSQLIDSFIVGELSPTSHRL